MAFVYKVTRTDGLEYIGVTVNYKNRIKQHSRSRRFEKGILNSQILFEGDYVECCDLEESYVEKYDTYHHGLNMTRTGKGKSETDKFNTFGMNMSDKTKEKLRAAAKDRKSWNEGKKYHLSPESLKARNDRHKNTRINDYKNKKINCRSRMSIEKMKEIKTLFEDENTKKEFTSLIGKNGKNGKPLTYERLFANKYADKFELTSNGLYHHVAKKSELLKVLWDSV